MRVGGIEKANDKKKKFVFEKQEKKKIVDIQRLQDQQNIKLH